MDENKNLIIFDLDNTLGEKTHFFPSISEDTINSLFHLANEGNILGIATDRPKFLVNRGLSKYDFEKIFIFRVYEDGLYVEVNSETIFNAEDQVSLSFKELKKISFNKEAVSFYKKQGFSLFPNSMITKSGDKYIIENYKENTKKVKSITKKNILVYDQPDNVRRTFKFPEGIFKDKDTSRANINKLKEITIKYFNNKLPGWKNFAGLKIHSDAMDIYPKISKKGIQNKGFGLSKALKKLNLSSNIKVYLCCDGHNDISMIEFIKDKFSNHLVICPSNVSKILRSYLFNNNINHNILKEDCNNLHKGLKRILNQQHKIKQ